MIKLIALDIDRTLLMPDRSLPDEVLETILEAKKKGALPMIASGRSFHSAANYAKLFGPDTPVLCYNGAMIRLVRGDKVFSNTIKPDLIREVLKFARENGLYSQIYEDDKIIVDKISPENQSDPDSAFTEVVPVGDLLTYDIKPSPKVLVYSEPEMIEAYEQQFRRRFGRRLFITKSSKRLIEIVNKGISKSETIAIYSEMLGIDRTEVMACGDNSNDADMLDWAAYGVAVANANYRAKENAEYVAEGSFSYGVAEAIKKFVLDEEWEKDK